MPYLNYPRADTKVALIVWLLFLPLPLYAGVPGSTSSINLDASVSGGRKLHTFGGPKLHTR